MAALCVSVGGSVCFSLASWAVYSIQTPLPTVAGKAHFSGSVYPVTVKPWVYFKAHPREVGSNHIEARRKGYWSVRRGLAGRLGLLQRTVRHLGM